MSSEKTVNVLIGCTGSVAAIKLPILVQLLKDAEAKNPSLKLDIKVVTTEHALHFYPVDDVSKMVPVLRDQDEWTAWQKMQDPVIHIELRRWADVMVIAPLDANCLAKLSTGICDNLLTCVVRAWDLKKPLLFCPAMNTYMWDHPVTQKNINILKEFGYIEVPCISKKLACGDEGFGAMAEVGTIVETLLNVIKSEQ